MKINSTVATVETSAVFDTTTRMSVEDESLVFILSSLTNLYSNREAAVLRETAGNAYDSHILAGQTRPVEVTLPTALNPSLVIRDYGVGMSRDELVNIYSKYGASTKRDTNKQIGAFGLGAKSPLALVDQFTVVSVKDGIKNTVLISKGTDGVGGLNFLPEKATDEANGVTVDIPIPDAGKMVRASEDMFSGWPLGSVLINGAAPKFSIHDTAQSNKIADAGWTAVSPERWGNTVVKAFIGPVLYTIELNEAFNDYSTRQEALGIINGFRSTDVYLNLPIGSVELTPSRENLVYNDISRTGILAALDEFNRQYTISIETELNKIEDRTKAFGFIANHVRNGAFPNGLSWKGESLPAWEETGVDSWTIGVVDLDATSAKYTTPEKYNLLSYQLHNSLMSLKSSVVVQNVKDLEATKRHVRDYVRSTGERVIKFAFTEGAVTNPWLAVAIGSTIEASELADQARAYRVEADRKAREFAKLGLTSGRIKANEKFSTIEALSSSWYSKKFTVTERAANTFTEDTKVMYLMVDETVDAVNHKLNHAIRESVSATGGGFGRRADGLELVIAELLKSDKDVALIKLPKGRNLSKFKEIFPKAVPVAEVVIEFVNTTRLNSTDLEKEWFSVNMHKELDYAILLNEEVVSRVGEISNVDTRAWVLAGANNGHRKASAAIGALASSSRTIPSEALTTAVKEYVDSVKVAQTKGNRNYGLLKSVQKFDATDVIEYVNMKDAQANK